MLNQRTSAVTCCMEWAMMSARRCVSTDAPTHACLGNVSPLYLLGNLVRKMYRHCGLLLQASNTSSIQWSGTHLPKRSAIEQTNTDRDACVVCLGVGVLVGAVRRSGL